MTVSDSADRIIAAWVRARAAGYAPGWYDREAAILRALARAHGASPTAVIAAAAALSPRVRWERVVAVGVPALLRGGRPSGFITRSVAQATDALHRPDPLGALRGPKVSAFVRALLGRDEPVVDVWSARIAGLDPDRLTPRRFREGQAAYREAARELVCSGAYPANWGFAAPARTVQEVTWEWARGGGLPVRGWRR